MKTNKKEEALPNWDLSGYYPSYNSNELTRDLINLNKSASIFDLKYIGKLDQLTPEEFAQSIKSYEEIFSTVRKAATYFSLLESTQFKDPERDTHKESSYVTINMAFGKVYPYTTEIMSLSDEKLNEFLQNPEVQDYKLWIDKIRRRKDHLPDESKQKTPTMEIVDENGEKQVVAIPPTNQLVAMYQEIAVQRRYNVDGKEYNETEIRTISHNDLNPEMRKKAIDAMNAVSKEESEQVGFIVNGIALNKANNDFMCGFKEPCDDRNLDNNIESETVNALTSAVTKNYVNTSHRFKSLQAKWYGVDKLPKEYVSAPLPDFPETKYSWEEAKKIVLDAYNEFDPRMGEIAQKFFDNNWIDAAPKNGKRSGAFSMPAPNKEVPPYVMVNFQGNSSDVTTLAHELGHGINQYLSRENGKLKDDTPIPFAETASIFGEMLVFKSMLKRETDPKKRFAMIYKKVQKMVGSADTQIAFHVYETKLHNKIKETGKALPVEEINKIWESSMGALRGPNVEKNPDAKCGWCSIPHMIRTPFYVYSYAFGSCLVNSLYTTYEKNKDPDFKDKYFKMISKGGLEHHSDLLKPFDIDLSKPDFWDKGIKVTIGFIDELEKLSKELGLDKGKFACKIGTKSANNNSSKNKVALKKALDKKTRG